MSANDDFVFSRSYRGKVKGLILDWSGTTADAYVLAPAVVFVEVFHKHGIEISMTEARGPMGLRKDLHILELTKEPEIRARWTSIHGKAPDQGDVDRMFADFVPMQLACLRNYTTLLPGVADTIQTLQSQGVKVGSTTGFLRSMVDILEEDAAKQGYKPDSSVAGDEVGGQGRRHDLGYRGSTQRRLLGCRHRALLQLHGYQFPRGSRNHGARGDCPAS